MQLKNCNSGELYEVVGPVYSNEITKIWCGKISEGEYEGAFVKMLNYGELEDKRAANELKSICQEEINTLKQASKCSKKVPSVKASWNNPKEKRYVIIMDTMPGVSLREWLEKHQKDELQAKDIFIRKSLAVQICEIMRDICKKFPVIVHRDLKPENIFINFNKNTKKWEAYIIDFGCANLNYIRNLGTTNYQAPEQIRIGNTRVSITSKTDIFAIGQIMYEMLLGRAPIIGEDYQYKARQNSWVQTPRLPEYLEGIPGVMDMMEVINKMTSFDIDDRPSYENIIRNLKNIKIG